MNMYSEGIPRKLVKKLFQDYSNHLEIRFEQEKLEVVSMVFNMQNFKDVIFFYLYGSLKKNVSQLYPDNLGIISPKFYKEIKSDKNIS